MVLTCSTENCDKEAVKFCRVCKKAYCKECFKKSLGDLQEIGPVCGYCLRGDNGK